MRPAAGVTRKLPVPVCVTVPARLRRGLAGALARALAEEAEERLAQRRAVEVA